MNIYVGNLDFQVNENDLERVFKKYGAVSSAKIVKDKFSGRSKGFGFVIMEDTAEANLAIHELNGTILKNRDMTVNEAKPRTENLSR